MIPTAIFSPSARKFSQDAKTNLLNNRRPWSVRVGRGRAGPDLLKREGPLSSSDRRREPSRHKQPTLPLQAPTAQQRPVLFEPLTQNCWGKVQTQLKNMYSPALLQLTKSMFCPQKCRERVNFKDRCLVLRNLSKKCKHHILIQF